MDPDPTIELLRHMLATIAYRTAKALRDTPPGFADYQVFGGARSPAQLLTHMGDLFDWALSMLDGHPEWREAPPLAWDQEVRRFFTSLQFKESTTCFRPAGSQPVRSSVSCRDRSRML